MKTVGFIGVGIMGKSMVRNLMKAGFTVHIYARNKEKVLDVIGEGAIFHDTIRACAAGRDAVITIVGYPRDVREVYFGTGGIMESASGGSYLIDMTTTEPKLAEEIYAQGKTRGLHCLDAPVTGGDTGAKNGTLSILAGGDRPDFDACLPLFQAMGNNIRYQGKAGSGQHAKMANQIMIAGTMSGLCEAIAYIQAKRLDADTVLASVSSGAAGSSQLNAYGKKIVDGDFAPGFFIKHFIKDMGIAAQEARESGLDLPVLSQVLKEYGRLEQQDLGDLGTQALIRYYE